MKTMTLRNVPDEVVGYLADIAKETRQSMNATVIHVLCKSMGGQPLSHRKRDLSAFAGSWSDEAYEVFERATADFGKIDEEMWQS